jgi:hypothetical protein
VELLGILLALAATILASVGRTARLRPSLER